MKTDAVHSADADGAPDVVVRAGMKPATRSAPKSVLASAITTPSTVSPSSQRSESSPVCIQESGDGHFDPIIPREEASIELGLRGELPQDHAEFVHSPNKKGPADSLCLDTENGSDTACKTAQIDSFQTSSTDTATSSGELTRIDIFLKEAKFQLLRRMDELKLELSKATTLEDSITTYHHCMKVVCVCVCECVCVCVCARARVCVSVYRTARTLMHTWHTHFLCVLYYDTIS